MNNEEHKKVEMAKIVKAIRDTGFVDEEHFEAFKEVLIPPGSVAAVERTIKGLSEEDEFALMCRLMGTTTHLVALEQRPILLGDYLIPDFLARFQPGCSADGFSSEDSSGCRCFVEVKSTQEDKIRTGGSRLRRLRNLADQFGLPLLFAVRFLMFEQNAVWVIVEDSNREATSLAVTLEDWINGIRHILWDESWYMLMPGIYFIFVFDLDYDGLGVRHQEYGVMIEVQIVNNGKVTSFSNDEATIYAAFLEAFSLEEVETKRQGSTTYQVLVPQMLVCSMADAVYKFNRLPCDERGQSTYDASGMIARLSQEFYDRDFVDKVALSLANQGFLGYTVVNEKEVRLKKWRRYGGKK